MNRFKDYVVVITGAANGIGEACAYRFAEEGARVVCLDLDQSRNQAVAEKCRQSGGGCF